LQLAIALSGLWRFTTEAIASLQDRVVAPLQRQHNVQVFVHAWTGDAPARNEIDFIRSRLPVCEMRLEPADTLVASAFNGSVHPHRDRYASQWEGVARAFDLVMRHSKPDGILRARMDLVYISPLRLPRAASDDVIYIPPVEGHYDTPFDPSVVNDQVAYGSPAIMEKYMTLSRCLTPSQLSLLELRSRMRPSRDHRPGDLKGIEGILREHLAARQVAVRRLDVFYRLQRRPESRKLRYCASLPMFVYGRSPNRLSPWLLDRSFALISRFVAVLRMKNSALNA
jgi:hypothetical protein